MGVYKKNNRWYIDYYMPNNKRRREVVTIPGVEPSRITRQDALKALHIRKAQIAEGKFDIAQTDNPLPFEELMSQYLEWAKENHRAPERDYVAAKPLLSFFKGKNVQKLNLWLVEKYKAERRAQGRKPETINKELGALRRMLNLAVAGTFRFGKLRSNPIEGMKLLKVPRYLPRVLKHSEFEKLYQAASHHFKPILLCAYYTGMRRGEIIKLKWKDVDLVDRYIHVKETKNDESRAMPICDILRDTLEALKENSDSEYVFTTDQGHHYSHKSGWKRAWGTALKKSGIGKCRFHDLRHTFISNLIVGEKEDYATVMALSGHKDITMLQRYSHTKEEAKKNAINNLGNHLKTSAMDTYLDTKARSQEMPKESIYALTSSNS